MSLTYGNLKDYANGKMNYVLPVADAASQAGPLGSPRRPPVSAEPFPPRLGAGHRLAFGELDTEVCMLKCELLPPGAMLNFERASSLWMDEWPGRGRGRPQVSSSPILRGAPVTVARLPRITLPCMATTFRGVCPPPHQTAIMSTLGKHTEACFYTKQGR